MVAPDDQCIQRVVDSSVHNNVLEQAIRAQGGGLRREDEEAHLFSCNGNQALARCIQTELIHCEKKQLFNIGDPSLW